MNSLARNFLLIVVAATSVLTHASSERESQIEISPHGSRISNSGAAANFTGHAQVEQLFAARDASRVTGGVVTFRPGARSAWHTHPFGQILIVTAGTGQLEQWGGRILNMRTGDVVWIPAGVKHWHGASPTSSVTHIAIQEALDGKNVDWLEPVTDLQYATGVGTPP